MRFRSITGEWPIDGKEHWRVSLLAALAVLPIFLFGQSKQSLEEKRARLLKDIKTTTGLLQKTTQRREAALDRYVVLQKQITRREELVQTLTETVAAADSSISRNEAVIAGLSADVERMKGDYGRMVRAAFRRKTSTHALLFLLDAETLNQAFRRLFFLKKYDAGRRRQAEAIAFTQKMLARKVASIGEIRAEKQSLLDEAAGQKEALGTELSSKESLLIDLEADQDRLRLELREKEKDRAKLDRAIEEIIRKEVERRAEEARRDAARRTEAARKKREADAAKNPNASSNQRTKPKLEPRISAPADDEEEDAPTADFRKMQGHLAWPVESGFISKNFGRQPHPTLKGIEITNNGIDIRTEDGATARAVAAGVVAGVQAVPGHDNLVIIRHGDFYTVYSNLSEVAVAAGQEVAAKQSIGRIRIDPQTEISEVHFEVWHGKERLDPTGWVKK